MQPEPNITWSELTKFVGQLTHDLRNHLNAIELQAAFLSEIATDPEAKNEIARLREMSGEMNAHMQRLSASFARIQPTTMRYLAAEFVEDLRAKLGMEKPELAAQMEWQASLGEEALEIDPHLVQEAFLELLTNAATHQRGEGTLVFEVLHAADAIEFILHEPKAKFDGSTENWGQRPLGRLRSGHYALGLFRANGIFEAHHGSLRAEFRPDTSTLVTTVSLPILVS